MKRICHADKHSGFFSRIPGNLRAHRDAPVQIALVCGGKTLHICNNKYYIVFFSKFQHRDIRQHLFAVDALGRQVFERIQPIDFYRKPLLFQFLC